MNKKMVDIHLTEDTLHAVSRAVGYGDAILAIAGMIRKGAPLGQELRCFLSLIRLRITFKR